MTYDARSWPSRSGSATPKVSTTDQLLRRIMNHNSCDSYIDVLVDHIQNLETRIDQLTEENTKLYRENQSWKLWMGRTIQRVKDLQN